MCQRGQLCSRGRDLPSFENIRALSGVARNVICLEDSCKICVARPIGRTPNIYRSVPWRLSVVLTTLEGCLVSMSAGQPLPGLSPFPSHFAFSVGKYYEAYIITEQNRSLTSWFTIHAVDFVCHCEFWWLFIYLFIFVSSKVRRGFCSCG